MDTNEFYSDYNDLITKGKIAVTKRAVPEQINDTIQNADIGINECESPEDFRKKILHSCRVTSERWSESVNSLIDKRLDAPQKTIMKGIISDIFFITDSDERKKYVDRELGTHQFGVNPKRGETKTQKTIYELYFQDKTINEFDLNLKVLGCMGSSDDGFGNFSRNTLGNWCKGTIPQDRNKVIRLAFWAKYTIEETDKLLESAGMHKLYLKGTGSSNCKSKSSLQDLVYIFMLRNENFSFATAQEIVYELDQILMDVEKEEFANKEKDQTQNILKKLKKLKFCRADFISYFESNLPDLLSSYRTLYGYLAQKFIEKYDVCKGNSDNGMSNSIRTLTCSRLKSPEIEKVNQKRGLRKRCNEDDEWRESLINTLYAAFLADADVPLEKEDKEDETNTEDKKKKKEQPMERVFSRKDIIILGLILNSSMKEINESLLGPAQEPHLYGRDFMENVIAKVTSCPGCELQANVITDKFTREYQYYYGITKEEFGTALNSLMFFYDNRGKHCSNSDRLKYKDELTYFVDVINALRSLKKYEWIKSVSIIKEIYPRKTFDVLRLDPFPRINKEKSGKKIADTDNPVTLQKTGSKTKRRHNLFVIHFLRKEKEKNPEKGNDEKKENKVNKKKEENYIETTIYLKKLKVVRPDAYQLSESLLSWYPEKAMFDFLVYKTAFYLRKSEYRRYLLPEGHRRFLKGEKIQYELPLYL